MNFLRQFYIMRKRIPDNELLKIRDYITEEIDRRTDNDKNNKVKGQ